MRSSIDRRQPLRSDRRRDAILESLDHHLQETSFESINIADISRHAGVSRSAFYFYFENKAAAVAALMEQMYEAFGTIELLGDPKKSPQTRIRAMVEAMFATWDRYRYLFEAMFEARAGSSAVREMWDSDRESLVRPVASVIDAERLAGRAPGGPEATLLASLLLEFNDRMLERLTVGGPLTRAQLVDGTVAIWLRTIYGVSHDELERDPR